MPALLDRVLPSDASQKALLADWLAGCHAADTLEQALQQREQLGAGQTIYVADGHSVSRHAVSFHAEDSERAGLLARAQEIENLERDLRAQTLITDESRAALVRSEAAHSDSAQQLDAARREAQAAQARAHELQVEELRLSQLAEQTRQRSAQIGDDLAEVDAQLEDLQARRVAAEAQFEALDMQLADTQERHAQLDERVLQAERALGELGFLGLPLE